MPPVPAPEQPLIRGAGRRDVQPSSLGQGRYDRMCILESAPSRARTTTRRRRPRGGRRHPDRGAGCTRSRRRRGSRSRTGRTRERELASMMRRPAAGRYDGAPLMCRPADGADGSGGSAGASPRAGGPDRGAGVRPCGTSRRGPAVRAGQLSASAAHTALEDAAPTGTGAPRSTCVGRSQLRPARRHRVSEQVAITVEAFGAHEQVVASGLVRLEDLLGRRRLDEPAGRLADQGDSEGLGRCGLG